VAKQRPDRQFLVEISENKEIMTPWKFFIIEITAAFGRGDRENETKPLKKVYCIKLRNKTH
jgi:hypothetical protein